MNGLQAFNSPRSAAPVLLQMLKRSQYISAIVKVLPAFSTVLLAVVV